MNPSYFGGNKKYFEKLKKMLYFSRQSVIEKGIHIGELLCNLEKMFYFVEIIKCMVQIVHVYNTTYGSSLPV